MNPKIMMIRERETKDIYTGIVFDSSPSASIFVVEEVTHRIKGQCLIEHSPEEFARVYDIVLFKKDFDLISYLNKAFSQK